MQARLAYACRARTHHHSSHTCLHSWRACTSGIGRYARAIREVGTVSSYSAYDGMPGIFNRSRGWVREADLSTPNVELATSDFVVSFEMAEHIPKQFETALLNNVGRIARRGVILSWSTIKGGVGHANPKPVYEVQRLLCERGFHMHPAPTWELRNSSYYWYFRKNILVFERTPPVDAWVKDWKARAMLADHTDMRTCGGKQFRCCRTPLGKTCAKTPSCALRHSTGNDTNTRECAGSRCNNN